MPSGDQWPFNVFEKRRRKLFDSRYNQIHWKFEEIINANIDQGTSTNGSIGREIFALNWKWFDKLSLIQFHRLPSKKVLIKMITSATVHCVQRIQIVLSTDCRNTLHCPLIPFPSLVRFTTDEVSEINSMKFVKVVRERCQLFTVIISLLLRWWQWWWSRHQWPATVVQHFTYSCFRLPFDALLSLCLRKADNVRCYVLQVQRNVIWFSANLSWNMSTLSHWTCRYAISDDK